MKKIITINFYYVLQLFPLHKIKELTLKEAINYALEHKADAEKARLEVKKSEYQIQEVRANALPNISASGGMVIIISYKLLILMLVLLPFQVCL